MIQIHRLWFVYFAGVAVYAFFFAMLRDDEKKWPWAGVALLTAAVWPVVIPVGIALGVGRGLRDAWILRFAPPAKTYIRYYEMFVRARAAHDARDEEHYYRKMCNSLWDSMTVRQQQAIGRFLPRPVFVHPTQNWVDEHLRQGKT